MKLTPIDRLLMVLAAAVIALLAFAAMQTVGPQTEPGGEASATEPPLPSVDVVALAVAPEIVPTPEPTPEPTPKPMPTPEPDKPTYNPAIPLSEDLQLALQEACEENGVELALVLGVI